MVAALLAVVLAAEEPPQFSDAARQLYEQGAQAYQSGGYDRAIELFSRAYALAPVPTLLFNIGQAYQLKGPAGCVPAARFYRRYLVEQPAAANRALVEQRLAELAVCAEDARAPLPPVPAPPAPPEPQVAPPPAVVVPPAQVQEPRRRLWPLAIAGAGAAAVVTGVVLNRAAAAGLQAATAEGCHPACAQTRASLQARATASYVLLAVGSALAAGGVVWVLVPPAEDAPAQVALAPSAFGLVLEGRF